MALQNKNKLITSKLIDLYIFSILGVFPLFFTNAYYNILPSKYYFYFISVIALCILLLLTMLIEYSKVKLYFKEFKGKNFIKTLTVPDIALSIFLIVSILSTLTSDYVFESFWGNEGRFSGLFLLIFYGVSYFLVTRFGSFKKWYLEVFLISGTILCLLGISDYFKMDILGFKVNMVEAEKSIFTSTIGNINTYTAVVGMLAAISATLFATENKNIKKSIYYYSIMVVNFFALIMGVSDNAYLSLAALFGLLPLLLFQSISGVKKYLMITATFLSTTQCIVWINTMWPDNVLGIEGAFHIISDFSGLMGIILVLWGIAAILQFIQRSNNKLRDAELTWPRYAWLALLIIVISVFCYLLIDANVLGNAARYSKLSNYLLFNDDWGTHRGFIWRNAIECYEKFSNWKKLVGYGPDTFGIVLLKKTSTNPYREIFDNAHNEYIHYLITVGAAGLLSYCVFVLGFCWRSIKNIGKNPFTIAALIAVVCYLAQATVNLNMPIATPLMWTLLTVGEMMNRGSKAKEKFT